MQVTTELVTCVELDRDEAVILRRVLDTAVLPVYDEEGDVLRKDIVNALIQQLYYEERR